MGEEYIPYDWGDDIDSPANDEYKKVYMNKSPNYNFSQKPQTQNLMQTPKPMQQTTQFQTSKPQTQTMKPKPQSLGLMPKQKPKGLGGYMADYKEIANKIWDGAIKQYPTYRMGEMSMPFIAAFNHWLNMDNKNIIDNVNQAYDIYKDYKQYKNSGLNDKYRHALINCRAAQKGQTAEDIVTFLSRHKEYEDVYLDKDNTLNESIQDSQANALGRILGRLNKDGNCEEMVSKHISRNY